MPFLLAAVPALIAGGASAAGSAIVGGIAGGGGGQKGTGFQAQQADLQNPTNINQANMLGNQAQGALGQQRGLVSALQAQGGIQNQSDVYGQQQALAGQLGQMAQGGGPNPALAQLAQTTGANASQQAALMAGQRGAGANAGLIARQAAQQGGALNQQAAGQGATMRAQQQLAAINALQQQQGMLGNLATQQVGQQSGAVGNLNQFTQAEQGQVLNSINNQNQAAISNASQANNANAGIAGINAQNQTKAAGGLASGVGSALGALGSSMLKPAMAEGGMVADSRNQSAILKENYKGPKSKTGQHLFANGGGVQNMTAGGHVPGKAKVSGTKDSYKNDTVDALLSPGEIVLPRSVTQSANPVEAAAKFVAAIKSKKQGK